LITHQELIKETKKNSHPLFPC